MDNYVMNSNTKNSTFRKQKALNIFKAISIPSLFISMDWFYFISTVFTSCFKKEWAMSIIVRMKKSLRYSQYTNSKQQIVLFENRKLWIFLKQLPFPHYLFLWTDFTSFSSSLHLMLQKGVSSEYHSTYEKISALQPIHQCNMFS